MSEWTSRYAPGTLWDQWLRAAGDRPHKEIQSVVLLSAGVTGALESHTIHLALISTPKDNQK